MLVIHQYEITSSSFSLKVHTLIL